MLDKIPKLRPPHVPPITFFRPISCDDENNMTDVEFLLGVLKKVNLLITQVNELTANVKTYDARITTLEENFDNIVDELKEELADFREEVESLIATNLVQAKAYTDYVKSVLEAQIEQIELGNIEVYDPTTGVKSPIQTVINNIYDSSRTGALTATEYDELELSATAYDAYQLTAFNYDNNGKALLV